MTPREKFFHLVWRHGLFDTSRLKTADGETVIIHERGHENPGTGPDFLNARLSIGSVMLAGNVEIHVQGMEWFQHQHHIDPAYGNVILHVVAEQPLATHCEGRHIPVLELGSLVSPSAKKICQALLHTGSSLPCSALLSSRSWPPDRIIVQWNSSAAARLHDKAARLADLARHAKLTDEDVAWAAFLRALGFGINSEPFQMLALRLPWHLMARHRDKLLTLAALIFGMSGLLEKIPDRALQKTLEKEFLFFAKDIKANPLPVSIWHYGGTRPGNHPHRRLAFFMLLYHAKDFGLCELFKNVTQAEVLKKAFKVQPSEDAAFAGLPLSTLSKESLHLIIVNGVAPFLAYLSQKYNSEAYFECAVAWLEQLPPEQNRFSRLWQRIGYAPANAFESQGILELTHNFCHNKGCMSCSIGQALIQSEQ